MSDESRDLIARRAWSHGRQWRVSAAISISVVIIVFLSWLGGRFYGARAQAVAVAATPAGTFRATALQLKGFSIEPVALHGFVSQELTEGKIAVNGDRATPVYSPYSGRVTRVIAGLGDTVKAGAPLATIEATEFVQAQNDLSTAVSQVKLARLGETRKHALYDAKGGSLQDWQQAQADLTTAQTTLNAARSRLVILGKSPAEILALESAHSIAPLAALVAPLAGVVVDRQVGPGQFVQSAAGTALFTIADATTVWLLANVRESDAGQVRVGQTVEVHVLAYPQRTFTARLTAVAAMVDSITRRLPVRAEIDNRDGALKPEMFANFRILTSEQVQAPSVPETAVVYEGTATHVWVITSDGLLTLRPIKVGRTNDGLLEVLEGLKAGERVVTKGSLFIDQAATPAST